MKIGWLHDDLGIIGGSELSERTLRAGAPEWAEIVFCPPNKRPPEDIEAYILQNCATYEPKWIEVLANKPVIKHCRDSWWAGSIRFRRWVLDNARILLFSSEMQAKQYSHEYENEVAVVPPPLNLDWFRAEAKSKKDREGAIWVGRIDPGKGLHLSCDWAMRTQTHMDVYGDLNVPYINFDELNDWVKYHGRVPYGALPALYGKAKILHFTPIHLEPFARTVAEAWASGCELIVKGRVGALEWIEDRPEDIGRGVEMFWDVVEDVLQ